MEAGDADGNYYPPANENYAEKGEDADEAIDANSPLEDVGNKFIENTRLSVSWFAKGGILDGAQIFGRMGNTLLGGGERGREAILPLDTNTGWMDVLANRIAQSLDVGGGNDGNVSVNVLMDGDLITSYVIKGMRNKTRAGTANV